MKQKIYFPFFLFFLLSFVSANGNIIYVNVNVPGGANDGTNWQNAFTDLQDALATAQSGDEVWVACGTYLPTADLNRDISFTLNNGVALYGGFNGTETQRTQRDWEANETILSGDIGIPSDSTDNSFTVVYTQFTDSTTVLDGFVISHGNANSTTPSDIFSGRRKSGGGLYIVGTSQNQDTRPLIQNCSFRNNYSVRIGGGIYLNARSNRSCSPLIKACSFDKNMASEGGAIYKDGGSFQSKMQIIDCTFSNNQASLSGAAVYNINTHGTQDFIIQGCLFEDNTSITDGTALKYMDINVMATFKVLDCAFVGNKTGLSGGGAGGSGISIFTFGEGGGLKVDGCLFSQNVAVEGTVSFLFQSNQSEIKNSIFVGNTGGGLVVQKFSCKVINCLFANNTVAAVSTRNNSVNDSFTVDIKNCTFFNNELFLFNIGYCVNFSNSIICANGLGEDSAISIFEGTVNLNNCLIDVPDCGEIATSNVNCGSGMIFNQYPQFRDTAAGDFSLLPCSPAINAGDNSFLDGLGMATDLAGNPRIQDGVVDMGPFEAPSMTILNIEIQPLDCAETNGGSVNFAIQNGCEPFAYAWQTEGSSGTGNSELVAGTYQFTITDANDRNTATEVVIPAEGNLSLAINVTPIHCHDSKDGTAAITPLSGTPPYEFLWQDGGTDSLITGIGGGLFSVTVTDRNACSDVLEFELLAPDSLLLQASAISVSCFGETDGSASVAVFGGKPPYSYFWDNGQTDSTAVNLTPGERFVTITDANGCLAFASAIVSEPGQLLLDTLSNNLRCYGENAGMAALFPSGGTPPYFYAWSGGETDSVLTNLPSGNYGATVTDSHQCTQSAQFEITEPDSLSLTAITVNISAAGAMDGAIEVQQISGGTPPYSLQWNTSDTTLLLENLAPGDYTLTVTDGNDCEQTFPFIVDVETAVQEASPKDFEVFLFPNPAQNGAQVWLSFRAVKKQSLQVHLLSIGGKVLAKQRLSLPPGDSIHALHLPIGAGLFLVQLENELGERRYLKVVVL